MTGWVKIQRRLLEWQWYDDINTTRLFTHILLKINYTDKEWRGIKVKRGQLLAGRKSLAKETGLSEQKVRSCINHLKSTNDITIQSTNKYSLITVNSNWIEENTTQEVTSESTKSLTNNQPTNNQQITTTKERKKERIKEKKERKKVYDDYFLDFWKSYPRKDGSKQEASKAYQKSTASHAEIMQGLARYNQHIATERIETQYIAHASTWLNGGRWEAEYETIIHEPKRSKINDITQRIIDDRGKNTPKGLREVKGCIDGTAEPGVAGTKEVWR